MFNFSGFLMEEDIPYWTEGKNTREGWIQVQCIFCNDHSNHLGLCPETGAVSCWKCGAHKLRDYLLRAGKKPLGYYFEKFARKNSGYNQRAELKKSLAGTCVLPPAAAEWPVTALKYLDSRGLNWGDVRKYGLYPTGPVGRYKFRIVIPIFWEGRFVSYTARDYTNVANLRYISASPDNEVIPHKQVLYNLHNAYKNYIILVEGPADVWRVGDGAVCSFGTAVTPQQILILAKQKKEVFILFDSDAFDKADDVSNALSLLGVKNEVLILPDGINDPGEMRPSEVQKLHEMIGEKLCRETSVKREE